MHGDIAAIGVDGGASKRNNNSIPRIPDRRHGQRVRAAAHGDIAAVAGDVAVADGDIAPAGGGVAVGEIRIEDDIHHATGRRYGGVAHVNIRPGLDIQSGISSGSFGDIIIYIHRAIHAGGIDIRCRDGDVAAVIERKIPGDGQITIQRHPASTVDGHAVILGRWCRWQLTVMRPLLVPSPMMTVLAVMLLRMPLSIFSPSLSLAMPMVVVAV